MFEDSLIESGGKLTTKRGKTTTFAVILQVVIIIVMILIPMVFTEAVPKVAVSRVRVSAGVTQGMLVRKVTPTYPPLARTARVQGTVLLAAIIGKDGTVQNLHVISGHPLLTQAAIDAVKQWRYKPYILNGEPVEVDTQMTVNCSLSGG